MQVSSDKRFAVLIDADNVSDKYIKLILDEISNDGIITYKRIYGDWTKPSLASWKSTLLDHSIIPVQQYSYTAGKNSTDSAMIIDAMDILYSESVEGFCLVSSDSDFTRLAARLRESGMTVVGMGERKTPKPFIAACNRFKYLDILSAPEAAPNTAKVEHTRGSGKEPIELIKQEILAIVREISDEDGWASLSTIGDILGKRRPDFDVRNYGEHKLTPLVSKLGIFRIEKRQTAGRNGRMVYIMEKTPESEEDGIDFLRREIRTIVREASDEEGWVALGTIGTVLSECYPGFDVRDYGERKLSTLVENIGGFEVEKRGFTTYVCEQTPAKP